MDNYPYIELITKQKLELPEIKNWYEIVKTFLPSGVLSSIQCVELENGNEPVLLVKQFDKDTREYSYKIPLTRDLMEEEVFPISDSFNDIIGDSFEYTIIASTLFSDEIQKDIEDNVLKKIAVNIARYIHTKEMNKLLNDGWRYGIEDDFYEKVSSKLLPFDNLGSKYQNVDEQLIEEVIRELNENGYILVKEKGK